jgi:hypothetical protein
MKYFVGRNLDIYPYRIYNSLKYFDTNEVIWRGDSLEDGKKIMKEMNMKRKEEKHKRKEVLNDNQSQIW